MTRVAPLAGLLLILVLGGVRSIPVALAGGGDHDRARRAVEAGEILPLPRILTALERDYPGQVMEVELERDEGRWVYEIKLMQGGGRMLKLEVDAADASVRDVKGREGRVGHGEGRER